MFRLNSVDRRLIIIILVFSYCFISSIHANETIEIYAPLAGRLGMHEFKDELEDLSFQILNPSAYSSLMTRI